MLSLSSDPSWDAIAQQAFQLIRQASFISPPVAEQAQKLHGTGGVAQFVMRAYQFVSGTILSETNSDSTLKTVPHSADRVLTSKSGDYTDKANLFRSLLKSEGVRSFFVLTKSGDNGSVFKDMPAMQFTHTLIWIPSQKGIKNGFFVDFSLKKGLQGVVAEGVDGKEGFLLDDNKGEWRFITIHSPQKESAPLNKNGISEDRQP